MITDIVIYGAGATGIMIAEDIRKNFHDFRILPKVKIGKDCKIGAGVVVHRDLEDNTVYLGRERKQS